jgi:ankyrin repeat protein
VDDVALVQLLLSNNADPNFNKHSISPITYAIEQGKMTIIRLLIEAGAILEAEQIRNPTVKLILQEIAMNRKKE